MNKIFIRLIMMSIFCCAFIGIGIFAGVETSDKKEDGLYATLETNKGDMIIKFTFKKTPLTVCNFVGLAEGTIENNPCDPGEPYFDGLIWHRVVFDHVIQSGCPYGTGSGGPGYEFQTEIDPTLKHDRRGAVGMALSGPGTATAGSQFYITHIARPHLDGDYTIFGYVEDSASQEVIMDIREDDDLERVTIQRVGAEAEAFRTDQDAFDSLLVWITGNKQKKAMKKSRSPALLHTRHDIISCTFKQSGTFDIGIYSLNGRTLFSNTGKKASEGASYSVPYSFRPGMYIATIKLGKNEYTHKLIVQEY
jgi:peptidylprolyl isomerase